MGPKISLRVFLFLQNFKQNILYASECLAAMADGVLFAHGELGHRPAKARHEEERIVAEAAATRPLEGYLALAALLDIPFAAVGRRQHHTADKRRLALAGGNTRKLLKEPYIVGLMVAIDARIARRDDARRPVQCLDCQPRIIGQCPRTGGLHDCAGLLSRIIQKRCAVLFDLRHLGMIGKAGDRHRGTLQQMDEFLDLTPVPRGENHIDMLVHGCLPYHTKPLGSKLHDTPRDATYSSMKWRSALICMLMLSLAAATADARPKKGFNTGPYLAFEFGISHNNFDINQRIDQKVGTMFEPTIGFLFGWNLYDWFAMELSGRYSTSEKDDRREHVAQIHLNSKFFLITDALTDFKTLRILPFGQVGAAINVAVLPGDVTATTDNQPKSFAYGPSVGAGVMFLFKKYVYLGLKAQGDFLFYDEIRQELSSGGVTTPDVLIYKGGFIPQFSAMGIFGVHF